MVGAVNSPPTTKTASMNNGNKSEEADKVKQDQSKPNAEAKAEQQVQTKNK
jgi:hypothetical protein